MTTSPQAGERIGRNVVSGVFLGLGVAAFVDETVFHQLLHWHHFYDKSTPTIGLVSDGYFHAGGWAAIVIGLVPLGHDVLIARGVLRARRRLRKTRLTALLAAHVLFTFEFVLVGL